MQNFELIQNLASDLTSEVAPLSSEDVLNFAKTSFEVCLFGVLEVTNILLANSLTISFFKSMNANLQY